MGSGLSPMKSQDVFAQRISMLRGATSFGVQEKDCGVKGVPHQGQAFNGAGDTRTPTWVYFVGFWLFQVPLAYYLNKSSLGATGVFLAIPLAETLITVIIYWLFKKGKWKTVKV